MNIVRSNQRGRQAERKGHSVRMGWHKLSIVSRNLRHRFTAKKIFEISYWVTQRTRVLSAFSLLGDITLTSLYLSSDEDNYIWVTKLIWLHTYCLERVKYFVMRSESPVLLRSILPDTKYVVELTLPNIICDDNLTRYQEKNLSNHQTNISRFLLVRPILFTYGRKMMRLPCSLSVSLVSNSCKLKPVT